MNFETAAKVGSSVYSKTSKKRMDYGTAGFRDKASELLHVVYRMGILAVLRSKVKRGATIGLMITASHNPEEDNGVKLCDPYGNMLGKDWEDIATDLANVDDEDLEKSLVHIVKDSEIKWKIPSSVYLARDTRSSSPGLAKAALDGIKALDGQVKDFGLLTTPQLHYMVCCKNNKLYGVSSPEGYYQKLSAAFEKLASQAAKPKLNYTPEVYVDGANGVGAYKMKELVSYLSSLNVHVFNDGESGILNYKCGSDFVKTQQKPPEGIVMKEGNRYASFDGDADRLIYYYCDSQNSFHMLDGDKISALIAKYFKDLIERTNLNLTIRVIQTAYANGNSTNYIENDLKIPVVCVPTGVKHLHHEAKQYDIGVYFEANGHGTVVFSETAKQEIQAMSVDSHVDAVNREITSRLLNTINLINETVGDAISDLLLVEAILRDLDWSIVNWNHLYSDLPYCLLKVNIPDKNAISTTNASRTCVSPEGLQSAIDSLVSKYSMGRAFVRPSGTENVVRVYAEADTQGHADILAQEISLAVEKFTAIK